MSAIEKPFTCKADERLSNQLRLEQMLVDFKPDPYEAGELIAAVLKRFRDDEEIALYSSTLYKSLDRYDARQPLIEGEDDQDDAYDLWRARQE